MTTRELRVSGMNCDHCVMSLRKELGRVPRLHVDEVKIGSARVSYAEGEVADAEIERAIRAAGFEPLGV